jgi:hypothetical protein
MQTRKCVAPLEPPQGANGRADKNGHSRIRRATQTDISDVRNTSRGWRCPYHQTGRHTHPSGGSRRANLNIAHYVLLHLLGYLLRCPSYWPTKAYYLSHSKTNADGKSETCHAFGILLVYHHAYVHTYTVIYTQSCHAIDL